MDFKFNLRPKPTKPTGQELEIIKALSLKLPPVTDAKMVETSGAKLIKQGFTQFDNGTKIVKGARYKFKMLVKVDHYQYMLKLFKGHGLEGIQAYVEFVKQVYVAQLELLNKKEADQLPGLPPNENNPT